MSPRTYEEEPQVSEYRRSGYDSSTDDRELTLSTPAILGLFFALVVVCGCFFGLGYAMGHRTTPTPQVFDSSTAPATNAAKPAAGSAAPDATSGAETPAAAPADAATAGASTATVPLDTPVPAASASASSAASAPAPAAPVSNPARPAASTAAPQTAASTASGSFVVQVAAVSSQDVANILLSTLQKKGYAVAARHEPQDQLLHIQIGPFPDRKDAEAMRQRVLADGFNAIVK